MASTYAPLRPPTERDTIHLLNGSPVFLGALVGAAGVVVNNATTATPFNATQTNAPLLNGTLAGKLLMLQPLAAGLVLASTVPTLIANPAAPLIALQSVIPPLSGTTPGVALANGSTSFLLMRPDQGWIQWLSSAGGNLLVFEMT